MNDWCRVEGQVCDKTWNGSDPKCGFETGLFTEDWNCGLVSRIRAIVYEGQEGSPGVAYQYCDDQKYATVCVDDCEVDALALWVSWYKNRGGTDAMWLLDSEGLPRSPAPHELVKIANYYEHHG